MHEPVIPLNPSRLHSSILPTLFLLTVSATLAAVVGTLLLSLVSLIGMAGLSMTPMILMAFPMFLGQVSLTLLFALIVTPLWALLGGLWFAGMAQGSRGRMARKLGVTFLPSDHPIVLHIQEMAAHLGLPPISHIGYYKSKDINAFAVGRTRRSAMIAFSTGCMEKMNGKQFMAVLGHELAPVANGDMRRMTIARGVQNALTFFLVFQSLRVLARWFFTLMSEREIMRFSRAREFYADAIGAALMGPARSNDWCTKAHPRG